MSGTVADAAGPVGEPPVRHPLPAELLHDLRTPLNHIIGYSELLIEEVQAGAGETLVAHLDKIRAAGYQLLSLIEERFVPVRSATEPPAGSHPPAPPVGALELSEDAVAPESEGTILVVDDVEDNRYLLGRRLENEGYVVETAASGSEALAMIDDRFDLVLLDIMMPDMDGYEVLRRLKEDEGRRHIPVIMVSAVDEVDAVVHCVDLGAEDYLTKPINPVLLKARVAACLVRKRARDREKRLLEQLRYSLEDAGRTAAAAVEGPETG